MSESIPNYTGHGWAGDKYAEHEYTDIAEIAQMVRKQIKEEFPTLKVSVRISRYSMGQSMTVTVLESPEPLRNPEYDQDFMYRVNRGEVSSWSEEENRKLAPMTEHGEKVRERIQEIVNQYRHDDSDGMIDYFDTNFYAHVGVRC